MQYAFQDFDNLYLVMDLLNGGDLRYHVSKRRRFTEEETSTNNIFNERVFHCMYYIRT